MVLAEPESSGPEALLPYRPQSFQIATAYGAPLQMLLQRDPLLALQCSRRQQGEIVGELFVRFHPAPYRLRKRRVNYLTREGPTWEI